MQVLFRGKDKLRNWKYGYYYRENNKSIIICSTTGDHIEILPETIGIYTNISTNIGKKIFTGDIVPISEYDVKILILHELGDREIRKKYYTKIVIQHCKVVFSEGSFGVYISKSIGLLAAGVFYPLIELKERQIRYGFGDIMVIGNSTDTPQLITPMDKDGKDVYKR